MSAGRDRVRTGAAAVPSGDDVRWATYESPVGALTLVGSRAGVAALDGEGPAGVAPQDGERPAGAAPQDADRPAQVAPQDSDRPATPPRDRLVLRRLLFPGHAHGLPAGAEDPAALAPAAAELDAYFAGALREFGVEAELAGTPFQRAVWTALREVGHGSTTSYGALARRVAEDRADPGQDAATTDAVALRLTRAVASAVARTPVPIVVPCHRVIGADGALTGYLGGLDRKRALLALERDGGGPGALRRAWAGRQLTLL